MKSDDSIRFWLNVDKGDDCWEWTGPRDNNGYGSLRCHVDGERKKIGAHRFAWILANGEIPAGLWVLHRCDNPSCVRPDHLFTGTAGDNSRDARDKGRLFLQSDRHPAKLGAFRGEGNGQAILSDNDIRFIRAKYAAGGVTHKQLAEEFGVTRPSISRVVSRKTWKHVA